MAAQQPVGEPDPLEAESLARVFFDRAKAHRDVVALRRKELGVWEELTWGEYQHGVECVASALIDFGLEPGGAVGLISENRVEWLMTDLGILAAAGVTCGVYPTSSVEQVTYIMGHSESKILFVEDEEQLDKILEVRKETQVDKIIVYEDKGLRHFDDPDVMFWDDLIAHGEKVLKEKGDLFTERYEATKKTDLAILVYTSGTTGPPKGVMLSHGNIIWGCTRLSEGVGAQPDDEYLSFLPLSHIAERAITTFNQVMNGSVVNFAENLDTFPQNLAEVRPHVFFAVPRLWEKFYNSVEIRVRDAQWPKLHVYKWALSVGREMKDARNQASAEGRDESTIPAALRTKWKMADELALRHLRAKLGLDRCRFALTAAAPISPEIIGYFQAIGVPLVEGWGMTETCGAGTIVEPGFRTPGTVGQPVDGLELKIAQDGEILAKSPGIMMGYYKQPEATAETLEDGWLHTGDIGEIDENGALKITDRKKDLIITAGGKNIAPQYIESKCRMSSYVHDAVVIGDRRKFISALIILDEDNLVEWAQKNRVQFGAYADLAKSPEVHQLIDDELKAVNKTLTHVEAIKKFRILERRLDRDEGELTATLKVRRKAIEEKYKTLIDGMYGKR